MEDWLFDLYWMRRIPQLPNGAAVWAQEGESKGQPNPEGSMENDPHFRDKKIADESDE